MERSDGTAVIALRAAGGIRILWQGTNAEIDIIAVHGLGSDPKFAWLRKVELDHDGKQQGKTTSTKFVNWLADVDMLPSQLPNSRIMTFDYLSKWHANSPVQRLSLCATQLLQAVDTLRRDTSESKHRPLILIGHSFGGIVIEQALVYANGHEDLKYIAIATIGVITLGTPFHGSKAAEWATMVAWTGQKLGFGSSKDILREIEKDSQRLDDLRHEFTTWLFRQSVPVYCFFEQYATDYGRRVGLSWSFMVVDERNACLDGHRKFPLPSDHLKLNKFEGPNDQAYLDVCSIIRKIACEEAGKVNERLNPRQLIESDTNTFSNEYAQCLRELYLTDPADDLAGIQRAKGKRIPRTCEWILSRKEYSKWFAEEQIQLLCLIGGPGNGKTMIATFLVEQLTIKATQNHRMIFAYYFCDNKVQDRRTSTAVLRGLLFQILKQRPALSEHIMPQFKEKGNKLFDNFDALCRVLEALLSDTSIGEAYIMIDALDECEGTHHDDLVGFLSHLLDSACRAKLLVISRPTIEIQELDGTESPASYGSILIDSTAIGMDLSEFIETAVDDLPKRFSSQFKLEVKEAIREQAGGTFLWASLVLADIAKARSTSAALARLHTMPKDLDSMYIRILSEIDERDLDDARCILQCVTAALQPLTTEELAVSLMIGRGHWRQARLPRVEDIVRYEDAWQCCGALLRIDSNYYDERTISLVHQSAKDFLLDKKSRISSDPQATCSFNLTEAHLQMFHICRKYLDNTELDNLACRMVCGHGEPREFRDETPWPSYMLAYYLDSFYDHAALAASHIRDHSPWFEDWARNRPAMPGSCMRYAAYWNHPDMVSLMLEKGVDVNSPNGSGTTSLRIAVGMRNPEIVQLLLNCPDVNANCTGSTLETPIFCAAVNANWPMLELLVRSGKCDLNATDDEGSPLLHRAARSAPSSIIQLLLAEEDVKPNMLDSKHRTPLSYAAEYRNEACIKLLLSRSDIEVNSYDEKNRTTLSYAAERGDEACVELLLSQSNIAPDLPDVHGRTSLSYAASHRSVACLKLLLPRKDVAINSRDISGRTPLSWAAANENAQSVALLLSQRDVMADSRDEDGRTPLSWAAAGHTLHWNDISNYELVLNLFLSRSDVLVDSFDKQGRSPLFWAAQNQSFTHDLGSRLADEEQVHYQAALELLLSDATIKARDNNGRTALSVAAEMSNVYLTSILLGRSNALVDVADKSSMTPLAWALKRGFEDDRSMRRWVRTLGWNGKINSDGARDLWAETVNELLQHGANINNVPVGAQIVAPNRYVEDNLYTGKAQAVRHKIYLILTYLEAKGFPTPLRRGERDEPESNEKEESDVRESNGEENDEPGCDGSELET